MAAHVEVVTCERDASPARVALDQASEVHERLLHERAQAMGHSRRMVHRKVRAAARLLALPRSGPAQRLADACVPATSVLRSRAQPGTIFLIIDGALHVMDTTAARPVSVPVEILPGGITFVQLVASSTRAGRTELLALVRADGASALRLWRFDIEATWATGRPLPAGRTPDAAWHPGGDSAPLALVTCEEQAP